MLTYKDAGVDIEKGDLFIDKIKDFARGTFNDKVATHLGGFCALYDNGDHYLASATDGVGTKIKLAIDTNTHHTIGQDLVAMCVNDLLCVGAKPLFFLDYLATSKLNLDIHKEVVKGIAQACKDHGIALIGGETAEMPGMYSGDDYDLAGFAVGIVKKEDVIDGSRVNNGDLILGLPSSGPHSNGFSLIRKVIEPNEKKLVEKCLVPTRIYVTEILNFISKNPKIIKGMAHITGGGFENISRINKNFEFKIDSFPEKPEIFKVLEDRTQLNEEELYRTFNMGVGLTLICDPRERDKVLSSFPGSFVLGHVN